MSLYYANVTVHLLAALFWLGGMFFIAIVAAPVLRRTQAPADRAALFQRLGERFRWTGWVAVGVLVLTGGLNLWFRGLWSLQVLGSPTFWATGYGRSLAWKLTAVGLMLVVGYLHDFVLGPAASRHDPSSPEAARARRRASWLARINALLGIVAVIAAVRLARGG